MILALMSGLALPVAFSAAGWSAIVISPDSGDPLRDAAKDMQAVLAQATGTEPVLVSSNFRFPENAIFLGDTWPGRFGLRLSPLRSDPYGAVFRVAGDGRIYLRAHNETALINGVYSWLQEAFGARWYWPGDDNLVLTELADEGWLPNVGRKVERPAFVHRRLWPAFRHDSGRFGQRNRLQAVYPFNHNLASIFDAALFEERPEVFATRSGRQQRPTSSRGADPQPHLAHPGAAEVAAAAVMRYFDKNPDSVGFSLSINDNILFDDSEMTRELVEPVEYFRNKPNYTDLVFVFMNRVAVKVFEEGGYWTTSSGEPRYLTALAYYWAEQSPSMQLHPRVLPVLTADRAQWHDPRFREKDRALIERWSASGAEQIGSWDYYFSAPHPYPRQFNQHLIDSIRHQAENNVTVFFAQHTMVPGFDGIITTLASRLLWDPSMDAEAEIAAFYRSYFGPAATVVRSYFEAFEQKRNEVEGPAEWIKFYKNEAGIERFPLSFLEARGDDLAEARRLAEGDPAYLQRIAQLEREYAFSLAYARFQAVRRSLGEMLVGGGSLQAGELQDAMDPFEAERDRFEEQLAVMQEAGFQRGFNWMTRRLQTDPTILARTRLALKEEDAPIGGERISINRGLRHAGQAPERFLFPDRPELPGWMIDLRPAEHLRIDGIPDNPIRGVRIQGADGASLFTEVDTQAGKTYRIQTEARFRGSPDCRAVLEWSWFAEDGSVVGYQRAIELPLGEAFPAESDEPFQLAADIQAPEDAIRLRLRWGVTRQFPGDFLEVHSAEVIELFDE